ncbi:MAG: hypothetical protein Q8O37_08510 [Sulfuricellaceae bacterium]|nr:hypothetical protein [Sulfuricellaceae bacterium]
MEVNIPGAFQAGRTNYTMGKQREAMNNRLSAQHDRLTAAMDRLKKSESTFYGYKSGEFHENGQPRAGSPSRAATTSAVLSYADFIRETVKPGDRVTFAPNPSEAGHIVTRLNKKTVTLDGGATWGYDNIQPWIDGKPASAKEVMAAFKAWRNEEGAASFSRKQSKADLPPVARSVIDTLVSRIDGVRQAAGDARITVVFAPSELPAEVLEQAKLQDIPENEIHGVLYNGQAFIVRQNLKTRQDVEEVSVTTCRGMVLAWTTVKRKW